MEFPGFWRMVSKWNAKGMHARESGARSSRVGAVQPVKLHGTCGSTETAPNTEDLMGQTTGIQYAGATWEPTGKAEMICHMM
jgi:hypothetical protein